MRVLLGGFWSRWILLVSSVGLSAIRVFGTQIYDDFASGAKGWIRGPGWSVTDLAPDRFYYRCNYSGDSLTWRQAAPLMGSWTFEADISFERRYDSGGSRAAGSLGLANDGRKPSVKLLLDVIDTPSSVRVQLAYLDGMWHGHGCFA